MRYQSEQVDHLRSRMVKSTGCGNSTTGSDRDSNPLLIKFSKLELQNNGFSNPYFLLQQHCSQVKTLHNNLTCSFRVREINAMTLCTCLLILLQTVYFT
mmetsp:Transcript_6620/g.10050  ORF Transcript_6620/g.10050 Transcript_6620/m.10050 type:complete len:99 (-) Transcript_6620:95-391(-)